MNTKLNWSETLKGESLTGNRLREISEEAEYLMEKGSNSAFINKYRKLL